MKKRSRYRPRGVIVDTIGHVLGGFRPLAKTGDEAVKLKIKNHEALANIARGNGTRQDIDALIAAMNIAEALAIVAALGDDYRAEISAAQNAIVSMGRRGLDKGRFVFTGPELTALNVGMEVHDAQLDVCTVGQLEKAIDFVAREIRARRAKAIAA